MPARLEDKTSGWFKTPPLQGLRGRLLLALAFAIGPVLAIVIFQAAHSYRETVARSQDELLVSALAAGQSAKSTLEKGRTVLTTLQSLRAVRAGGEPCREALQEVNAGLAETANVALLSPDGQAICSAQDLPPEFSARGEPWFERSRRGRAFVVSPLTVGPFSQEPVVILATPAVGVGEGRARGVLALSIRVRAIDRGGNARRGTPEIALADQTGQILTGSRPAVGRVPAAWIKRAEIERGYVGFVKRADGRRGNVAVAPLIGEDIFVVLSSPTPTWFAWTRLDIIGRLLLPVTMFGLALATVWWAADRLVLRSVRDLRALAGAYAQGDYGASAAADPRAPEELQALRQALVDMAGRIEARDTTLKDAIEEKQTLLREVHHRVKNNLQIMVSLFNMQLRTLGDKHGREALEEARARVTALALVHQALYEGDDLRTVELGDFIDGLVRTLVEASGGAGRRVDVSVSVNAAPAPASMAVPLALFIVEATTNALKHAFPDDRDGAIEISVQEDRPDQLVRVLIRDNGVGLRAGGEGRTGASLMTAFARQLGGQNVIGPSPGGGAQVSLVFPMAGEETPSRGEPASVEAEPAPSREEDAKV